MDAQHQLLYAVQVGDEDATAKLLSEGALANLHPVEISGSPLHQAAYEGHLAIIELLLAHGAVVDSLDEDLRTPLHVAAFQGHTDLVRLLLHKGANELAVDKQGNTWVHLAAKFSRWQTLDLLLEEPCSAQSTPGPGTSRYGAGPWSHLPQAKAIAKHLGMHGATCPAQDPLPSAWTPVEDVQPRLRVDGTCVSDLAASSFRPEAIKTIQPVPDHCLCYFYEVEVLDGGGSDRISIGLSDPDVDVQAHVGWKERAYGYHGDDGKKFTGSGYGCRYGPKFSDGDVIGVLWDRMHDTIRFYKNSADLGLAFHAVNDAVLYPSVGFRAGGAKVAANFGDRAFRTRAFEPPLVHALERRHQGLMMMLASLLDLPIGASASPLSSKVLSMYRGQPHLPEEGVIPQLLLVDWEHVLHAAAQRDDVALMQLALDRGTTACNRVWEGHQKHDGYSDGQSTLVAAAKCGAAAAVQLLLELGAGSHPKREGEEALYEAAANRQRQVVNLFLRKAQEDSSSSATWPYAQTWYKLAVWRAWQTANNEHEDGFSSGTLVKNVLEDEAELLPNFSIGPELIEGLYDKSDTDDDLASMPGLAWPVAFMSDSEGWGTESTDSAGWTTDDGEGDLQGGEDDGALQQPVQPPES